MNAPSRQDKFKAYRARKKAAGLRELRFWAPDVDAPHFQRELDAQIERINAAEDEREALIFCERAAAEVWAAPDRSEATWSRQRWRGIAASHARV